MSIGVWTPIGPVRFETSVRDTEYRCSLSSGAGGHPRLADGRLMAVSGASTRLQEGGQRRQKATTMSAPRSKLWPLEAHTRGKHLVLKNYVNAWLPILGSTRQRILFIDGFAGPGEYAGGEEG